jgi:ADP-ribose pyrophosphatase YjhB (NUDIX family)
MGAQIYAVLRRGSSDLAPSGAAVEAKANQKAHRIAAYPLDAGDCPVGVVAIYMADSVEALLLAGPNVVQPSDEVIPVTDQCLMQLLADAIAGMLGVPPSTVRRELGGPPPDFDRIQDRVHEQPLEIPHGSSKKPAAGIIVVDENGRLTIVEPRNHFGGYAHTYPKGHAQLDRETLQQAAHREVFEETGLRARIIGLVGDFPGDTTITRYYIGALIGGTPKPTTEAATVKTLAPIEALALLNKRRDRDVLRQVIELAASEADWEWTVGGETWRCRLVHGRIRRIQAETGSEAAVEDTELDPLGIGVWAPQFNSTTLRFWFRPQTPQTPDALYERVAGILLRELGNDVLLSALWMDSLPTERPIDGGRWDGCVFILGILPRERYLSDDLVTAHSHRLSRAVIAALADRTAEHWPPVDTDSDSAPTSDA